MTELVTILLVEDNPGDVRLTLTALERGGIANSVHVVSDGIAALDFLYRRGEYSDAPRPDLIFLDLNLPRKDGREVLAELKSAPGLRRIPIVVLTTSDAEEDVLRSYDLHANCYITKPLAFPDFVEVVNRLEEFWFGIVRRPAR